MAVEYTGQQIPGPVITGTTAGLPGDDKLAQVVVKATFDKVIGFKLRSEPMYRRFADVRPIDVAYPGSSVDMFIQGDDLALATSPLAEYADPDSVPLPAPRKVTLTPFEYGNATVTTLRLRDQSWAQVDPYQAELLARNLRDSVDKLVESVAFAATGGVSGAGFTKYYVPADTEKDGFIKPGAGTKPFGKINSKAIRRIVANFRGKNVMEFDDGHFIAMIHPDQSVDLREETDVAGWRFPHTEWNANTMLWNGTVGTYESVQFIESPRVPVADGVYKSLFLGKQGLAEGVVREFGTVLTPQLDKFGRLHGVGWYGFAGWCIYREEAGAVLSTGASTV
jgi:N4-gp56 family major capsid protein